MAEPLFPEIPQDLKGLSDDELQKLEDDHVSAAALIKADDEEFLAGLSGEEVISQFEKGVETLKLVRAEKAERAEANEQYEAKKAELLGEVEETPAEETDEVTAEETVEVSAEQ